MKTETFNVEIYRDKAMTELVDVMPIEDIGMIRADRLEPSGDELLIHIAMEFLRNSGHDHPDEYTYRVVRSRPNG